MANLGILTPEPEALGRELRESDDRRLARRRKVIGLSFLSAGAMQVVALFQSGVLSRMPEPDLPKLDADAVDASGEAYRYLSTGDGFLGLLSYGATAALAAIGPADRAREAPWLPLGLAAKAVGDAAVAAKLSRDQWTKHRAFCSWCLLSAAATLAVLPLVWPEAREALRELRDGRAEA